MVAGGRLLVTFGLRSDFSKLEKLLFFLLLFAFGFGFLRAVSYPVWAWDGLYVGLEGQGFLSGPGSGYE